MTRHSTACASPFSHPSLTPPLPSPHCLQGYQDQLLDSEALHRVCIAAAADFRRVWARYGGRHAGRNLGKALKHLNTGGWAGGWFDGWCGVCRTADTAVCLLAGAAVCLLWMQAGDLTSLRTRVTKQSTHPNFTHLQTCGPPTTCFRRGCRCHRCASQGLLRARACGAAGCRRPRLHAPRHLATCLPLASRCCTELG